MSRRPIPVNVAAVLLVAMGTAGLAYAIVNAIVVRDVSGRMRAIDPSASAKFPDHPIVVLIQELQLSAVLGVVLAALVFAAHLTTGLLLRKGWNAVRIIVWVLCGLGILAGIVALVLAPVGDRTAGTLGAAVQEAYPDWWVPLNIVVLVAQIVGYLAVGTLLVAGARDFFASRPAPAPVPQPAYPYSPSPPRLEDDQYWSRPPR